MTKLPLVAALALTSLLTPNSAPAQIITIGATDAPIQGHYQYWTTVSASPSEYIRCADLGITNPVERGDGDAYVPGLPWEDDGDWRIWTYVASGYKDLLINSRGRTNWNNRIELEIKAFQFPLANHFDFGDDIRACGWHVEDWGHSVVDPGHVANETNGGKTELHPIIYLQKGALEARTFKLFTAQDGSGRFPLAGQALETYFSGWLIPLWQSPARFEFPPATQIPQIADVPVSLLREDAQVDIRGLGFRWGATGPYPLSGDELRTCWRERQSEIVATQSPGWLHVRPRLKGYVGNPFCLQPLYFGDFTRSFEPLLQHRIVSRVIDLPNGDRALAADVTATLKNSATAGPFLDTEWRFEDSDGLHVVKNPPGNSVTYQIVYHPSGKSTWSLDVMASTRPPTGWLAENLTALEDIGVAYRLEGEPVVHLGSGGSHQVYARSESGDLIHYYWSAAAGWAAENLTTRQNVGAGYRFESQPVAFVAAGAGGAYHVYARNQDGELIHYYWSSAAGWAAENVTARQNIGAGYRITGNPAPLLKVPAHHVYGRSEQGDLIRYSWLSSPVGWKAENVTAQPNIGTAYRVDGEPSPLLASDGSHHLYARNAGGALVHYYWSPAGGWAAENATGQPGIGPDYRFVGQPLALLADDGAHHIYARNAKGDLIHYYWSAAAGWAAENVTGRPGIGGDYRFVGQPVALLAHDIYARNGSGDLIHYHWSATAGWAAENVTARPNIGSAYRFEGQPRLPTLSGFHVYVRNGTGDLIRYSGTITGRGNWSWVAENLTARPSIEAGYRLQGEPAPLVGGGLAHHVYGRDGDGSLVHYYYWPETPNYELGLASPQTRVFAQARLYHDVIPTSVSVEVMEYATDLSGGAEGQRRLPCVTGYDVQAGAQLTAPGTGTATWRVAQERSASGEPIRNPVRVSIPTDGSFIQLDGVTVRLVDGKRLQVRFANNSSEGELRRLADRRFVLLYKNSASVRVFAEILTSVGKRSVGSTLLALSGCSGDSTPSIAGRWKELEKVAAAILRLKQLGLWPGDIPSEWPRQLLQTWAQAGLPGPVYEWYPKLPAEGKRLVDTYRLLVAGQPASETEVERLMKAIRAGSQLPDFALGERPSAILPKGLGVSPLQSSPLLERAPEVFLKLPTELSKNQPYVVDELEFDDEDRLSRASVNALIRWSGTLSTFTGMRIDMVYVSPPGDLSRARATRRVEAVRQILVNQGIHHETITARTSLRAGARAAGQLEIRLP